MEEVDVQIKKVEEKIEKVEGDIEAAKKAGDRDEVAQLRREKEQLRKEKEQLREKELIGLKRLSISSDHPSDVNVVNYLLETHGNALRAVHAEAAPGAERESAKLDPSLDLPSQMKVKGRGRTYLLLVANLARIFRRWKARDPNVDARDFQRGLAHLLLLSSPGSGKTTVLVGVLRWLRSFLKLGESELQAFVAWAMYQKDFSELVVAQRSDVEDFLVALKGMAGQQHLIAMLRAQDSELRNTEAEQTYGIRKGSGAALRLLYACLTPLNYRSKNQPVKYRAFVEAMNARVREKITVDNVLDFVKAALGVPDDQYLMLLLLIDEGNAAEGVFGASVNDGKDLTWLKQMLSACISRNSSAPMTCTSLVLTLTVTTRWASINLEWTESGRAMATYLPMHSLSLRQFLQVVLDMAQRAARSAGREPPSMLPPAWRHLHALLGGNPRLLSLALLYVGARSTYKEEVGWGKDLDCRIVRVTHTEVADIIIAVKERASRMQFWTRIKSGQGMSLARLKVMLAAILLDKEVARTDPILPGVEAVSWGDEEADASVKLDLQAPGGGLPLALDAELERMDSSDLAGFLRGDWSGAEGAGSSSQGAAGAVHGRGELGTRAATASKRQKRGSARAEAGALQEMKVAADPCEISERPGSSALAACSTPQATVRGVPDLGAPPDDADAPPPKTSIFGGHGTLPRNVRRSPMGSLCEDAPPLSPSTIAIAVGDHLCPAPTAVPGSECVRPSMSILTFITLLRSTALMHDSKLSVFSELVQRESPLDKEFVDAMAPCLKLQALALLGRRDFALHELFHGLPLDEELASKRFIVPMGRLSVGSGQREAAKLSKEAMEQLVEQIRESIVGSVAAGPDACTKDLDIGFVGVGNKGEDSLLVLVEADDPSRAWCIVVQSKQHVGAKREYETVRGMLRAMKSDLKGTFSLPALHGDWKKWQKDGKDEQLPAGSPSTADWDDTSWDQRVVYVYVSDRLFSKEQDKVRSALAARKHPWMRRLVVVAHREQWRWHSRAGALLRFIRAAAMKDKQVRDTLRS